MTLLRRVAGAIPTDHFVFFVETHRAAPWDIDAHTFDERLVAVCPAGLAIATERLSGQTRVEVEIHDSRPDLSVDGWDRLEEQPVTVSDQELVIYGPESTGTDRVLRVPVDPGRYLSAVLIGGLDTVTDDVGGVGDDHYRVHLWPAGIDADSSAPDQSLRADR